MRPEDIDKLLGFFDGEFDFATVLSLDLKDYEICLVGVSDCLSPFKKRLCFSVFKNDEYCGHVAVYKELATSGSIYEVYYYPFQNRFRKSSYFVCSSVESIFDFINRI